MLEIKNLHAGIGGKKILQGIDLKVKAGEVHAIMGPNGSGKSTLSQVLAAAKLTKSLRVRFSTRGKTCLIWLRKSAPGKASSWRSSIR
jgi:Fe-S cluster assembly ATP-binding protein